MKTSGETTKRSLGNEERKQRLNAQLLPTEPRTKHRHMYGERRGQRKQHVQTLHENKNTNVRLLTPAAAAAAIQFYGDKFMTNFSVTSIER